MKDLKLEQEIAALYERSPKTQSLENFSKIYYADKGNNIDGIFSQVAKLAKVAPVNKIDFHPVNTDSNLTPEQRVAFAGRREAMGMNPKDSATVKLAKETIAQVEKDLKIYFFKNEAEKDVKRQQLLAKAKVSFKAAINKPIADKYALLKQKFGAAFNISEDGYLALSEKQKSDAELDLSIAIKNGKIKCPTGYSPISFSLLDEIRRERGW